MSHVLACTRTKVAKLPQGLLPQKFLDCLREIQHPNACCRAMENHEIEAFFSCEGWRDNVNGDNPNRVPDIYHFHCTCGKLHVRFCVGRGDERPAWEIR